MEKTIICHSNDPKFQAGFKAALEYLKEIQILDEVIKNEQKYTVKPSLVVVSDLQLGCDDSFGY